jgi:hypothetical protein
LNLSQRVDDPPLKRRDPPSRASHLENPAVPNAGFSLWAFPDCRKPAGAFWLRPGVGSDGSARSALASPAAAGWTRICYKLPMHASGVQHLLPIASVAAGLILLVAPRIASVAVAVYLIFVGLLGLNGIYHLFK